MSLMSLIISVCHALRVLQNSCFFYLQVSSLPPPSITSARHSTSQCPLLLSLLLPSRPLLSPSLPLFFPRVCLMDWCYYLYLLHPSIFKAGRWLYLSGFSVLKRRLGHCSAPLPVWGELGGKRGGEASAHLTDRQIDSGNNHIPPFIMCIVYTLDGCPALSGVNQAPGCKCQE